MTRRFDITGSPESPFGEGFNGREVTASVKLSRAEEEKAAARRALETQRQLKDEYLARQEES